MTINPDGGAHDTSVSSPFTPPPSSPAPPADLTTDPDPRTEYTVPSATPGIYELYDRDDVPFTVLGCLLGYGTSRWEEHTHPAFFLERLAVVEHTNVVRARIRDLRDRFAAGQLPDNVYSSAYEEATDYLRCLENPEAFPENVRRYADLGERCSACRWFELRLFRVDAEYDDSLPCSCGAESADPSSPADDVEHDVTCGEIVPRARYLVLTYGRSEVPGEFSKRRAVWTNSPHEMYALLTQRQRGDRPTKFMPSTSQRALAQAASLDPDIERLFLQRSRLGG